MRHRFSYVTRTWLARAVADGKRVWTAWGFLGANALPAARLDLGPNIRIEPINEDRRIELARHPPRMQHPTAGWPDYFSAIPAEIVVHSHWAIWFRATTPSLGEAWDEIEYKMLPLVIAAFAGFSEMPPRVELLQIGETSSDGAIAETTSQWSGTTVGGFATRPLTVQEAESVAARFRASRRHASVPSRLWYEATILADKSDRTPRSLANIILTFFQVIEHIARQETTLEVDPSAIDTRSSQRLVEKLTKSLNADSTVSTKIRKIRAAKNELDRLERRFLNQKISAVGDELALDQETIDSALELAELRNRSLSHPGRELPEALGAWVERSTRVSAAFLTALLDARSD